MLTSHHRANSMLYMGIGRLVERRGWNSLLVATQATHSAAPMDSQIKGSTGSSTHTPKVDAVHVAVDAAGKPLIASPTPAYRQAILQHQARGNSLSQ